MVGRRSTKKGAVEEAPAEAPVEAPEVKLTLAQKKRLKQKQRKLAKKNEKYVESI